MITKREKVKGKAFIWAIPTSDWERNNNPEVGVFRYKVGTEQNVYCTGAVKVCEHEVELEVPAGVNLLERAIVTLNEEKTRVLGEAQKRAMEIQEEINKLLMIGHEKKPEIREVEGELLPPEGGYANFKDDDTNWDEII
jgi:hypothetical protein